MTDFDPGKLKHKPSKKHALDEVLKSLQDLIHNDLLRGAARGAGPSAAALEPATTVAAGMAPSAPASTTPLADMPFGSVVKLLEELVAKELADDDRASRQTSGDGASDAGPPATAAAPGKPASAQQMFAFDDRDSPVTEPSTNGAPAAAETPTADAEPAAANAGDDADRIDFDLGALALEPARPPEQDVPVLTEPMTDAHPAGTADAGDLPVLQDVAAPGRHSLAHEIAERVVARLNAGRQARGEPALDTGVLVALRVLLRSELERLPSGKQDGPE
jgi:hypothetical protein